MIEHQLAFDGFSFSKWFLKPPHPSIPPTRLLATFQAPEITYASSEKLSQNYQPFSYKVSYICDRLCKNRPSSHLVVIRETPVQKIKLKLPAFAGARPLLFNRTGLSNLLNKIQFTFEVVLSYGQTQVVCFSEGRIYSLVRP